MKLDHATVEALLAALADAVAERVVDRLRAGEQAGHIDQAASSLGRRRHIAAVRRRLQSGAGGAVQVGRRYLLSDAAHAEEVARASTAPGKRSRRAELMDELGLEGGSAH